MSSPAIHRHLHRPRQPRTQRRSLDSRYVQYEMFKQQLTATARTPAEYDAAVREAARRAGV